MVDALEAAWRGLRSRGLLVDLQPDDSWETRVAVLSGGRRCQVGRVTGDPDPSIAAAHRALARVMREGRFRRVAFLRHHSRTGFSSLAALYEYFRSRSNPPRLAAGTR